MYCGQHIKLPKLGMVKIRDKKVPQGRMNSTLFSRHSKQDTVKFY